MAKAAKRNAPPTGRALAKTESRREKFLRIGQGRMVNALHAIRLIGNLAGPIYDWSESDLVLMHNTLSDAVEDAFKRFAQSRQAPKAEETFRLGDNVSRLPTSSAPKLQTVA